MYLNGHNYALINLIENLFIPLNISGYTNKYLQLMFLCHASKKLHILVIILRVLTT